MRRKLRTRKLVKTSLQLRLVTIFVTLAFIATMVQVILLNRSVLELASRMPSGGDLLLRELPGVLGLNLLITALVLVPIVVGVGILVTHRIAGPVYRFEQHLGAIARGEPMAPCRLRKGDELMELCAAINAAVAKLEEGRAAAAAAEAEAEAATEANGDGPVSEAA